MPIDDSRTIPLGIAVPAVSILVMDTDSLSRPDPEICVSFSRSRQQRHG